MVNSNKVVPDSGGRLPSASPAPDPASLCQPSSSGRPAASRASLQEEEGAACSSSLPDDAPPPPPPPPPPASRSGSRSAFLHVADDSYAFAAGEVEEGAGGGGSSSHDAVVELGADFGREEEEDEGEETASSSSSGSETGDDNKEEDGEEGGEGCAPGDDPHAAAAAAGAPGRERRRVSHAPHHTHIPHTHPRRHHAHHRHHEEEAEAEEEAAPSTSTSRFQGLLESFGLAQPSKPRSSDGGSLVGLSSQRSQQLSFSVATSAASEAFRRTTSKLHELAMGDDHTVRDRWDDYDDDNPVLRRLSSASVLSGVNPSSSRRASNSSVGGTATRATMSLSHANSSNAPSSIAPSSRRASNSSATRATPLSRAGSSNAPSVAPSSAGGRDSTEPDLDELAKFEKPAGRPERPERAWAPTPSPDGSRNGRVGAADSTDLAEDEDPCVEASGKGQLASGFVYEHATVKVLLWYYVQTLLYSGIVAAVSIPLVTLFSSLNWHVDVEVPEDQDGIISPIQPNNKVFQWMLLFWIANPLTLYCPLLLACIKRSIRLPWQMYAVCAFTLSWGAAVCGLFYAFDVPYWYWYLDLFIVLAAYVPCMCTVGWFIEDSEDATWKDRMWDIAFTATLETVVAGATLLYCFFLMPLFYALVPSWQKLVWLCVIHPLYFELTTGFIVRKALHRNSVLGRTNIMYFLTIVHGMAHQVSITTMLQASVEPTRILAVTVLLYNVSKLFWRSTVIHRHLLFDRVLKGWSFRFSEEEHTDLARMVSVHVLTEVVLENASILVTPYLMSRMYEQPLFMMVIPRTFYETGGAYPARAMAMMIFVMLSITVLFDVLFWLLNYHVLQFLPLINTWRRIKKARFWYLSFLLYAFSFMGVLFVFLIMMLLPRGTYCKSNNYCDCVTASYASICEGHSFTMHHDYLVDIDPSLYT